MRFQANTVRIAQVDGVITFAMGDEGETPSVGVVLQLSEEVDDQDEALGFNGLYFEAIHADVSGYGIVSSLNFDGNVVRIEMKPSVQDIDRVLEIEVKDDSCEDASLKRTIEMMSSHVF